MSDARHSSGTLLHVNDNDDGTTFAIIENSEVIDITGPELMTGVMKATHLSSPSNTKEKKPGLKDGGKVSLKMAFTNEALAQLKGYWDNRDIKNWRVVYPLDEDIPETTQARWNFTGFVSKIGNTFPDAESDSRVECDVDIECSGVMTFTEAT